MNRTDMVEHLRKRRVIGTDKRTVENAVLEVLGAIAHGLYHEGEVRVMGFGTFLVKERKERMARNPRTGEPVVAKAHNTVVFKPSKDLKESIQPKKKKKTKKKPAKSTKKKAKAKAKPKKKKKG